MYIRCVAYRISNIERSVRLKIRFYGYDILAEIRFFDILGFYKILIYFWWWEETTLYEILTYKYWLITPFMDFSFMSFVYYQAR